MLVYNPFATLHVTFYHLLPPFATFCYTGFADIVGRRVGSAKLPWNPQKSWAGSAAMFGCGSLIALGWGVSQTKWKHVGASGTTKTFNKLCMCMCMYAFWNPYFGAHGWVLKEWRMYAKAKASLLCVHSTNFFLHYRVRDALLWELLTSPSFPKNRAPRVL